eukprot:12284659-Alexandrium_andersonii.AAC.1
MYKYTPVAEAALRYGQSLLLARATPSAKRERLMQPTKQESRRRVEDLSLIHISEPTRLALI